MEIIKTRRSVRGFKPDAQISDEALNTILEAAMYAPLAVNKPSWHLTVIQSKAALDEIVEKTIDMTIIINKGLSTDQATPKTLRRYLILKSLVTSCLRINLSFSKSFLA